MMRNLSAILILMLFTVITSAAEDRLDVAIIEKDRPLQRSKVLPPMITEKYEYYEVCGCREEELHCDLKKKCLTWNDGNKYDSLTSWDIKWDREYNQDSKTCAVNSFKPIINFTYRYPKWNRTDDAPKDLIEKWDRYLNNLIAHETGHRVMVVEAVNDLSHVVVQLPPAPACVDLDRTVRVLFRKSMEKMKNDQRDYDETTKHGTTQGAVFP
jgi:predicted secreted Zn-dependent protease